MNTADIFPFIEAVTYILFGLAALGTTAVVAYIAIRILEDNSGPRMREFIRKLVP